VAGLITDSSSTPAFVPGARATAGTTHSSSVLAFLAAFAIALALVLAAAALLPARVLVGPASSFVEPRRDALFIGGVAVAILIEIVYVVGGS
jgi:hypothetical protein